MSRFSGTVPSAALPAGILAAATLALFGPAAACAHGSARIGSFHSSTSRQITAAAAVGDAPAAPAELAEIVVTARKRKQPWIDVPVAVTVVGKHALGNLPTTGLTQIGNLVPGVSLENMGGGSSGAAFEIRGVGQLAQDYNSEQPVALNIDGVQLTDGSVGQLVFFDLQSVQVLKGPQALFFGKNSPAGVVAITSANPGKEFGGYVHVGYEFAASSPSVDAAVSIPLTDTLSLRIAGHYDHDNSGYIMNRARPIADPFEPAYSLPGATYPEGPLNRNGALRVTLAWKPSSRFNAIWKLLGSYHHDVFGATEEVVTCGGGAHPIDVSLLDPALSAADPFGDCAANHVISNGNAPTQIVSHFWGGPLNGKPFDETNAVLSSLRINYHLSKALLLTSVTGAYHSKHNAYDNYDLTVYAQALDAEYSKFTEESQELRLTSSFNGPVNFMTGVYYEHDTHDVGDTDRVFDLPLYPGPGPFNGVSNDLAMQARDKADSYSVFANLRWKILTNLEFTGGARYSHDEKSAVVGNLFNYFDLIAPTANPFSPAGIFYRPSVSANNFSPEVTLTYHPRQDVTLYGAFKTGYLAPGIGNPANITNVSTLANPDSQFTYKAETVRGFEGGAKGFFLHHTLMADLTIYRYVYRNLQVATFHPETLSFLPGNAGKARDEGVEFQGAYEVVRGLRLRASLDYNYLRFLSYPGAQCYPAESPALCSNGTQNLSGTSYGDGPFTARFGFQYTHMLPRHLLASIGANVSHTTAAPPYERDPLAVTPAYTMVNATLRVAQTNGPWAFNVIGTNLSNDIYYKNFIFKPLGVPGDIGAQSVSLPRMVEIRADYRF